MKALDKSKKVAQTTGPRPLELAELQRVCGGHELGHTLGFRHEHTRP